MSQLTAWFKRDTTKVILKAALNILKVLMGKMGEEVWKVATEEVVRANAMPLDGTQKFKMVTGNIKSRFPEIKDTFTNLVTELAVTFMKESLLKR